MEKLILNKEFDKIFKEVFSLKKYKNPDNLEYFDHLNGRGVYFLFVDDIITYIGITQNFEDRLFTGWSPHFYNKKFTHYSILEIEKPNTELEKPEYILINFFDPKDNIKGSNKLFVDKLPVDYYNHLKAFEAFEAKRRIAMAIEAFKYF
jgi:hypothetical protein